MNAAARKRIAAAQRKRWAEYKKTHGTTTAAKAAPAKAKRVLSAAARRHIAEATKKRWAEYRAAKAAGQKGSTKKAGSKRAGRKVAVPAVEGSAT